MRALMDRGDTFDLAHDDLLTTLTRELRGQACPECGGELAGTVYRGEELSECVDCEWKE